MPRDNQCRFCPAQIRFIVNQNGKTVPIEVKALTVADIKAGDMMILEDGRQVKNNEQWVDYVGPVYRPHFPFCPGADKARKPR